MADIIQEGATMLEQYEQGPAVAPRPWRSTKGKDKKVKENTDEKKEGSSKREKKSKTKSERRRRMQSAPTAQQNTWLYSPSMYKRRFCAFFPEVHNCKRAAQCAFAHSREEFRGALLSVEEEQEQTHSDDFYMHRYKTMWCPIGVQHDWQSCVYAHNYMDARRDPRIGYGLKQCPHWDKRSNMTGYEQRCPQGVACPFAHGAKEQLYHPGYFKTVVCWDVTTKHKCPRGDLCAFHHSKADKRESDAEEYDYSRPLSQEQLQFLQPDFRTPPPIGTDEKPREKPMMMGPCGPMQPMHPMMMVPVFPANGDMDDNTLSPMSMPMSPDGRMMMVPMMMPPCFGPDQPGRFPEPNMSPPAGLMSPNGMVMVPVPMSLDGQCFPMQLSHQRQNSGSSGSIGPMSPMDRYTQDILNADGETFDLDFEKFASRFSDVSTDDKDEDKDEQTTNSDPE